MIFSINLFQAIRRLSEDDHEVIKESCVILNRVFTTVEFKDTMETFEKEPEKLGQHILIKEEEEMKSFEKKPEKLGQPLLSEDVMYFIKFMLVIICSLIFPVALMYAFNLNN